MKRRRERKQINEDKSRINHELAEIQAPDICFEVEEIK
jgi:hypothetical protein